MNPDRLFESDFGLDEPLVVDELLGSGACGEFGGFGGLGEVGVGKLTFVAFFFGGNGGIAEDEELGGFGSFVGGVGFSGLLGFVRCFESFRFGLIPLHRILNFRKQT